MAQAVPQQRDFGDTSLGLLCVAQRPRTAVRGRCAVSPLPG